MAIAVLDWKLGDNTGDWGWVRRGWDTGWADPSRGGRLLAHDILEHLLPNQTGEAHQELAAFGAIIYGRYNSGMLTGNMFQGPEESLATEILGFLEGYLLQKCVSRAGYGRHHYQGPRSGLASDALEDIQQITYWMSPDNGGNKRVSHDEAKEWLRPEGIKFIESWIVKGYLLAHQRYRRGDTLASLFASVQDAIDTLMKKVSSYGLDEGSKMIVRYNPDWHADTTVKIIFSSGEEYYE